LRNIGARISYIYLDARRHHQRTVICICVQQRGLPFLLRARLHRIRDALEVIKRAIYLRFSLRGAHSLNGARFAHLAALLRAQRTRRVALLSCSRARLFCARIGAACGRARCRAARHQNVERR